MKYNVFILTGLLSLTSMSLGIAGERANCKKIIKRLINTKFPGSKIVDIIHHESLHTHPVTHTYQGAVKVNHEQKAEIYYLTFEGEGNKHEGKDCEASVNFYGNMNKQY
ncbi:hypothetical protein N9N67_04910 [Bacteriovoracaceae bacterium]|nr:hypothetical protein [Bacteriovoracaceae bacterium]